MTRVQRRHAIDPQTRTAYHEAGHAVLSAAINDKPHHVSIRAAHGTLGRSGQRMFARAASLAQVYLAGFAAEHVLTGRRPRQYDIETGLAILAHTDPALVSTFEGIEASDGYGAIQHLLRMGVRPVEEELRQEVDRLYEIARASVSAVWVSVRALAQALLTHEELDREGLNQAIGDADIYSPVFAVQQAHGLLGFVPTRTTSQKRQAGERRSLVGIARRRR
jgi:ATP-dependent Zn protease